MKIVIAPDSFKGSLSANEICDIVEKAAAEVFLDCEVLKIPVADGGEGTVDSVLQQLKGEKVTLNVKNALGEEITTYYGVFDNKNAIMEMANASGLPLIEKSKRDVMRSNTYGTGEMILHAINNNCEKIYIGIGGSATNDCGIGCLAALGVLFLDDKNNKVEPIPLNFKKITTINTSNVHKKLKDVEIIIMSDVKNIVVGEKGATNVFGRQKGASEEEIKIIEDGMNYIVSLIEKTTNLNVKNVEGGGGAGGLGAGLFSFTNASMKSGVETVLEILDFHEKIEGASLVVTGEGMMDFQSAFGKVAYGVGMASKRQNIPCVAIVGGLGQKSEDMFEFGIDSIITTINSVMTLDYAILNAKELCFNAALRLFKSINAGIKIINKDM